MFKLFKKALLIIGFILLYFLGIREVRKVVHELHLGTVFPEQLSVIDDELEIESQSSVSFTFYNLQYEKGHGWQYKIPFGSFFLLAVIGLILIDANGKEYATLASIHIIGGLISFLFVLMGINIWINFLIIPDLLGRYLIPISSLGYVALSYVQKKQKVLDGE